MRSRELHMQLRIDMLTVYGCVNSDFSDRIKYESNNARTESKTNIEYFSNSFQIMNSCCHDYNKMMFAS